MTKSEANMLLSIAKATYPNAYKAMNAQEKKLLTQTWAVTLADIPVEIVLLAFFQHVSKSKWPPTPAEIRDQASQLHSEAEDLLRQTRFMDDAKRLSDCESSKVNLPYLRDLESIAESILRKTDHLSRGLRGNENSLTLSAMINAALSTDPADSRELRALLLPYDTWTESDSNT